MSRFRSFDEFWPFYLREHTRPATRGLHYAGSLLVLACLCAAWATGSFWFLIAAPLVGYGFAWLAHLLVEHNRPATFRYPLWSFLADWRMLGLWLAGRLGPEIDHAAGSDPAPPQADQT